MNAEQKRAWLGVITGAICIIGYFIALQFIGPFAATGVFGLFGLNGFSSLIFRRTPTDERDQDIAKRATSIGAIASYEIFVLGNMGVWFVAFAWHRQAQVSVHLFPLIVFLGGITLFFVRSVVLLVLYARQSGAEDA